MAPNRVEEGLTNGVEPEIAVSLTSDRQARSEKLVAKLQLLWEQRRFLLRVTVLGLAMTILVAFLIPKRYQSTARLMPPDPQSSSGMAMLASLSAKAGSGLGAVAGNLLGLQTSGALFVGILESRTVGDRLVDRFDLKRVYDVRLSQEAREELARNTAISEDRKTGILTITVTDKNPQRAAAMGQAYVDELNRLVVDLNTSAAHRQRVFLEERLKAVQQDLQSAEKDFSEFASKNATIDIKEQGRTMVEAAARLQGGLIAAQSELEGLRQFYTDNNIRVRSVRARIAELQLQLQKLSGTAANPGRSGQERDTLYPSIRELPLLGVSYAEMYRHVKVQEAVFEALTQQYELAKVEEARETPSVKLLDRADVPERKSFPPRRLIVFLGTFFSLVLGAFWILGSAYWKQVEANDPGKIFLQELAGGMRAYLKPQGGRLDRVASNLRHRLHHRSGQMEDTRENTAQDG